LSIIPVAAGITMPPKNSCKNIKITKPRRVFMLVAQTPVIKALKPAIYKT
jgi:hypothetical protein